jgi:hypothetical protein
MFLINSAFVGKIILYLFEITITEMYPWNSWELGWCRGIVKPT